MTRAYASDFTAGDVVIDLEHHGVLGIVTDVRKRGLTVVWEHGASSGGPGLLFDVRHHEPHVRLEVPAGALGSRGWNRKQAVAAALRKAGLR